MRLVRDWWQRALAAVLGLLFAFIIPISLGIMDAMRLLLAMPYVYFLRAILDTC
jgi:hypothetical protein